jgi:formiminotetrahydrofolate cyclodeaminase
METALGAYALLGEMAENGNRASISDVGVGLLAVRAGIEGAAMNVRINLAGLKDEKVKADLGEKAAKVRVDSDAQFQKIVATVEGKLG